METNDTTNQITSMSILGRRPRGERAPEPRQDTAATPSETSDAVESAPKTETPAPKPETREEWKHRRAIALGLIKP
jgi:hypothetical protein